MDLTDAGRDALDALSAPQVDTLVRGLTSRTQRQESTP